MNTHSLNQESKYPISWGLTPATKIHLNYITGFMMQAWTKYLQNSYPSHIKHHIYYQIYIFTIKELMKSAMAGH